MLLLVGVVHGQQNVGNDDLQTYVRECRIIYMVLQARDRQRAYGDVPENDDFVAAGRACNRLDKAISSSNPSEVRSAAADLRPILTRQGRPPASPQEQLAALEKATAGASEEDLEWKLPDLAKRAFAAGETEKARSYAKQLLAMASRHPKFWNNYGNAIFYGNFVLGRIAVRGGNIAQAEQYLLASGATPGSPQLDSFGPSMTLAKELLEKGKSRDVVLQYLEQCKKFWDDDEHKLDEWSAIIRRGGIPDFGS